MRGNLLIDMSKCRECTSCTVRCSYFYHPGNNGITRLREMASFRVACRRCTDSPCVLVCPASALEKDQKGILHRAQNLCVACKSCVSICPFGTLMDDFFEYRASVCDLCPELESPSCLETCAMKALSVTGMEECDEKGMYLIQDRVLVKDVPWEALKREPQEDFLPNEDII